MNNTKTIALGGGCHWCTEAVFQSIKGVEKVEQGYVNSINENAALSEAVIVHFNPQIISLRVLIEVHLRTHKSTSNHSFRRKYRSAIYFYSKVQEDQILIHLEELQQSFKEKLQTKVLPFNAFKASREELQNYYFKDPKKPFCTQFIDPKLEILKEKFSENYQGIK